ncbi:hypothetical protein L6452_30034 [Arctium lappa]|uniref:Uncharacterized protein n=1 Tax=Arctium lappa TaxID=4217 RepID=A0ACB8ZM23_ARCLA|nr:hypothetical protein L6452_30034 [Arctium lappa]
MEEEDPLGYYKSWNHIIGGDLFAFQTITTPGEYFLSRRHFFSGLIFSVIPSNEEYIFKFRAFSQRKFNEVGGTLESQDRM